MDRSEGKREKNTKKQQIILTDGKIKRKRRGGAIKEEKVWAGKKGLVNIRKTGK